MVISFLKTFIQKAPDIIAGQMGALIKEIYINIHRMEQVRIIKKKSIC